MGVRRSGEEVQGVEAVNDELNEKGLKYDDWRARERIDLWRLHQVERIAGRKLDNDYDMDYSHPPRWIYWLTYGAWAVVIVYWVYRWFL